MAGTHDEWPGSWYRGNVYAESGEIVGCLDAALIPRESSMNFHALCGKYSPDVRDMATRSFCKNGSCVDASFEASIAPKGSILFIESVFVKESHRGRGLGQTLAQRLMRALHDKFDIAVLYPCPLRIMGIETVSELHVAASKLYVYWQRIGFRPVAGTKLLAWKLAENADVFELASEAWREGENVCPACVAVAPSHVSAAYPLSVKDAIQVIRTEGREGYVRIEKLLNESEETTERRRCLEDLLTKVSAAESHKSLQSHLTTMFKSTVRNTFGIPPCIGDLVVDKQGYLGLIKDVNTDLNQIKVSWGQDWTNEWYDMRSLQGGNGMRAIAILPATKHRSDS